MGETSIASCFYFMLLLLRSSISESATCNMFWMAKMLQWSNMMLTSPPESDPSLLFIATQHFVASCNYTIYSDLFLFGVL